MVHSCVQNRPVLWADPLSGGEVRAEQLGGATRGSTQQAPHLLVPQGQPNSKSGVTSYKSETGSRLVPYRMGSGRCPFFGLMALYCCGFSPPQSLGTHEKLLRRGSVQIYGSERGRLTQAPNWPVIC
jgi:hypothetical protein